MPIFDDDQPRNMHVELNLLFPALLNFVTLKFHGSSSSPFETHPFTVFFSIFALLLYCSLSLPLVAYLRAFTTAWAARVLGLLRILSFYLSIALPTSLLFPIPFFFLLHLPLLMLLSADRLYSLIQEFIRWMQQEFPAFVLDRLFLHPLSGGRTPPVLPITVADAHLPLEY